MSKLFVRIHESENKKENTDEPASPSLSPVGPVEMIMHRLLFQEKTRYEEQLARRRARLLIKKNK